MFNLMKGVVKFFNSAAEKLFGFVRAENGNEIFFHLNDYRRVALGSDLSPTWAASDMWDNKNVTPDRNPRPGDRLVFNTEGGRRDKGPKAKPWAYESELIAVEKFAAAMKTSKPWAASALVGVERDCTSGWFPTTYYRYYPDPGGAVPAGMKRQSFENVLLYKSGNVVVSGRTAKIKEGGEVVEVEMTQPYSGQPEPVEPVVGIIPPDAPDGYWFWDGQKWLQPERTRFHVDRYFLSGREHKSYYVFVGLGANGQPIEAGEKYAGMGFPLVRFRGGSSGQNLTLADASLPEVHIDVQQDLVWSTREMLPYTEPNLTKGIPEAALKILGSCVKVIHQRKTWLSQTSAWVIGQDKAGEEIIRFEIHGGSPGSSYRIPVPSEPALVVYRTPNRTFYELFKHDDASAPSMLTQPGCVGWTYGPAEEEIFAQTKGQFFFYDRGSGRDNVFCPHGFLVETATYEQPRGGRTMCWPAYLIQPWLRTATCPFGCQEEKYKHEDGTWDSAPEIIDPLFRAGSGAEYEKQLGLEPGKLYNFSVIGPVDVIRSLVTSQTYSDWNPAHVPMNDGLYASFSSRRVAVSADSYDARERAYMRSEEPMTAREKEIFDLVERLGMGSGGCFVSGKKVVEPEQKS